MFTIVLMDVDAYIKIMCNKSQDSANCEIPKNLCFFNICYCIQCSLDRTTEIWNILQPNTYPHQVKVYTK